MPREKSDDLTMAMKFRSLGMTAKDLDRIAGIGEKFDILTNNILGHFAGYDSGAYSNVPLEFVESLVRMLANHGYVDWGNVPRTGPREQFERYKEKSRGDKRLPPSSLANKVAHLVNFGITFELEDEKDFPTNGFSYISTKEAYFLKSVFDNATCRWRVFLGEDAIASNKHVAEFTHEEMLSFFRQLGFGVPLCAIEIAKGPLEAYIEEVCFELENVNSFPKNGWSYHAQSPCRLTVTTEDEENYKLTMTCDGFLPGDHREVEEKMNRRRLLSFLRDHDMDTPDFFAQTIGEPK